MTAPEVLAVPTVTDNVPQAFEVSQTVIVALPFAMPFMVIEVPDKFAEVTAVFELLEMLYVPLPPEIVTAWLAFGESVKLFGLKVIDAVEPVRDVTDNDVQLAEVPV